MNTELFSWEGLSTFFDGFEKIKSLNYDLSGIPNEKGLYIVFAEDFYPEFLPIGTGGFFKRRNPNIPVGHLQLQWVKNAYVIYIGKAGGKFPSTTLKSRIKKYLEFGSGKPAGHYLGRFIWQIKEVQELYIGWKVVPHENIDEYRLDLLKSFIIHYGMLPFANYDRPDIYHDPLDLSHAPFYSF